MIPNFKDNGVSPVIAVLLILAMTVVAAGIVGVVATGMTGDLQNGKQVGLIVKPAVTGGDVPVTIVSGKDVPELTKLEVIDGGSANAEFREVAHSDGSAVALFTAGAGYVAKNVADPTSATESYITPVVLRGTFVDGTEAILLQTKVTFRDASPASPIKEYIKNFYMKSNDSTINISLADLFYSGKPLSVSLRELANTNHRHKLIIDIPEDMIQDGMIAKIVISRHKANGEVISDPPKNNYASGASGKPQQDVTLIDGNEVAYITVSMNVYDKNEFDTVWKSLNSNDKQSVPWDNERLKQILKATQTGTITILHENS